MIDRTKIVVKAGNGGNGAVDFGRRRSKTFGPPLGGDGGKGGDVYLLADKSINSLIDFSYRKLYDAPDGKRGEANQRSGEAGHDLTIKVPHGTVVIDSETGKQIVDIASTKEPVLIAVGGKGGRGNMHMRQFASHVKHPVDWDRWQMAEQGQIGEEKQLLLELKLLADIGLVGYPNAGKSTLLSVLTAARPKIADYPFTTIEPNLGVVKLHDKSYVIADIPGLIEGASQGKGLGKDFLRHVERTKVIIHLTQHYDEYTAIRKELGLYNKELLEKPEIVVLSKVDTLTEKEIIQITKEFAIHRLDILPISAVTHYNLALLLDRLEKVLK